MRGFSLIEALVSLGIAAVLLAVVVTGYQGVLSSHNARQAASLYTDALREAQTDARLMEYDTASGVALVSGDVVLFSGTSYAARTTSRDRSIALPGDVTISGPTEVVFAKFTGTPSITGTTTFENTYASSSVGITTSAFYHRP